MPIWSRLQNDLNRLIGEIIPCTTTGLLPEWEETLGLPDPCTGPLSTTDQRRQAVCTKFTARGGQSIDYFIKLLASFGYDGIVITQYAPFRCGINTCGQPLYGEAWAFAWKIEVPISVTITYFTVGLSTAGDPLRAWGDKRLECLIERYAPSHTIPIIAYTSTTGVDHVPD
jgi:uncharacterized protein YmfQ (DUF2313 family)